MPDVDGMSFKSKAGNRKLSYVDEFNREQKTHPKCGQPHCMGWQPGLSEKGEKWVGHQ